MELSELKKGETRIGKEKGEWVWIRNPREKIDFT